MSTRIEVPMYYGYAGAYNFINMCALWKELEQEGQVDDVQDVKPTVAVANAAIAMNVKQATVISPIQVASSMMEVAHVSNDNNVTTMSRIASCEVNDETVKVVAPNVNYDQSPTVSAPAIPFMYRSRTDPTIIPTSISILSGKQYDGGGKQQMNVPNQQESIQEPHQSAEQQQRYQWDDLHPYPQYLHYPQLQYERDRQDDVIQHNDDDITMYIRPQPMYSIHFLRSLFFSSLLITPSTTTVQTQSIPVEHEHIIQHEQENYENNNNNNQTCMLEENLSCTTPTTHSSTVFYEIWHSTSTSLHSFTHSSASYINAQQWIQFMRMLPHII